MTTKTTVQVSQTKLTTTEAEDGPSQDIPVQKEESDVVVVMNVALKVEGMSKKKFHSLDPEERRKILSGLIDPNISANANVAEAEESTVPGEGGTEYGSLGTAGISDWTNESRVEAEGSGLGAEGGGVDAEGNDLGAEGGVKGADGNGKGVEGNGAGADGGGAGVEGSGVGADGMGTGVEGSGVNGVGLGGLGADRSGEDGSGVNADGSGAGVNGGGAGGSGVNGSGVNADGSGSGGNGSGATEEYSSDNTSGSREMLSMAGAVDESVYTNTNAEADGMEGQSSEGGSARTTNAGDNESAFTNADGTAGLRNARTSSDGRGAGRISNAEGTAGRRNTRTSSNAEGGVTPRNTRGSSYGRSAKDDASSRNTLQAKGNQERCIRRFEGTRPYTLRQENYLHIPKYYPVRPEILFICYKSHMVQVSALKYV